jgi:hypothetical protein
MPIAFVSNPAISGTAFIIIGVESGCQDVPEPSRFIGQDPSAPIIGLE